MSLHVVSFNVLFVFFLSHNSEFPALSADCHTVGNKIVASFIFHFMSERENFDGESIDDNDDGDIGDSSTASDDDLRSNMAGPSHCGEG